jgi:hypothetical protein
MSKKMPKPTKKSMPKMKPKKGGKIKVRGTGAATKGLYARGPMA